MRLSGGEVVAIGCVGSDHPFPAVAVCCSGSGLPAEESPEKESHIFMKGARSRHSTIDYSEAPVQEV